MTTQSRLVGYEELSDDYLKVVALVRKLSHDCRAFLQNTLNSSEEYKPLRDLPPAMFGEVIMNLIVRILQPVVIAAHDAFQRGGNNISKEQIIENLTEHLKSELDNQDKPRRQYQ